MSGRLVAVLTADDPERRDLPLTAVCAGLGVAELLAECDALDRFRRGDANLYARVRALLFLAAIHRYELPARDGLPARGRLSYAATRHLRERRFEEAIAGFLALQAANGPSRPISSALAAGYRAQGFQLLADQVRRSVRSVRGNQWMFRIGHPLDQPLRIRPELLVRPDASAPYPILRERTAVRADLTHSAWSDIFFLGMDRPEAARVVNLSVDLGVRGRDSSPRPPIEAALRVIDRPVLRLCSVDLGEAAEIDSCDELFDFARDHLGLLKAGLIAAGLFAPGLEGSGERLAALLERTCGPGRGIELVTRVRDIPKGSRLAVSTNLLASIIAVAMRATGQSEALTGPLSERARRLVAARAILGEWLGGSGGGWQDSGGIWPGIKLIAGRRADSDDPEFGVSRGRLLPDHEVLDGDRCSAQTLNALRASLVLVHGGMAQNVGPILEMVTEKYLLRSADEWTARQEAGRRLDDVLDRLANGDVRGLARTTHANFLGPIRTIVPWASNRYTESLLLRAQQRFGDRFWGFCMLGGMSGGGMGFFLDPSLGDAGRDALHEILLTEKRAAESAMPFAMDPVIYDFEINQHGTVAELLTGNAAWLPDGYYPIVVPALLRAEPTTIDPARRAELERLGADERDVDRERARQGVLERILPRPAGTVRAGGRTLAGLLEQGGFDAGLHEQVRADLRTGRIGLVQNRLPRTTRIEDVVGDDVVDALDGTKLAQRARGSAALAAGEVAVVTLAAGAASRWTHGAGVVKALNPFCRLAGEHRSFLELHLAKTRATAAVSAAETPHVVTTSLFTHEAIQRALESSDRCGPTGPVVLSPGRAVGLRMVPTERDLRFLFEETERQVLDERAQRMREHADAALIAWAKSTGEAADYVDNVPLQCLHPVGHWFEVPNMLRNGVLAGLCARQPRLRYLMVHNIDTVGVHVDPGLLGVHIERGATFGFEVIPREVDDVGGGLARVDGRPRLVEGLALPDERIEYELSYYNTGTCWVTIDALLTAFGLTRADLADPARVDAAVRRLAARMPTYVTIKDVKKRWGSGHEDVFPVTQFEKLWGDMTALPGVRSEFFVVPRVRGQQLKDPAQLDQWLRDGSAAYVESLAWP